MKKEKSDLSSILSRFGKKLSKDIQNTLLQELEELEEKASILVKKLEDPTGVDHDKLITLSNSVTKNLFDKELNSIEDIILFHQGVGSGISLAINSIESIRIKISVATEDKEENEND